MSKTYSALPPTGPLFGRFFNLSSRIAPPTKTVSATQKSVATDSTLSPVSPRQDWGFSRLDEEAAIEGRQGRKSPSLVLRVGMVGPGRGNL